MQQLSFAGVATVAVVAFIIPLGLGFFPRFRLPSSVVELLAGVALGPSVLGWVKVDVPIQVMSLLGLASLLFLSGLEIDFEHLRGRAFRLASFGFLVSVALALIVAYGLQRAHLIEAPLFVAIALAATAIGMIIPVLKDSKEISTNFGQVVLASASIATFTTMILLSLLFSRDATSPATRLLLLGGFALLAVVIVVSVSRMGKARVVSGVLVRLQGEASQIRVRGAAFLVIALIAVAERVGLEAILAAFIAGAILKVVDRNASSTHPDFRMKLEAIGFGVFVPVFFVTSGLKFNLQALLASPISMAKVPIFLVALLVVRGFPAWMYRSYLGTRKSIAAGFLQATKLTFIVAAVEIGNEMKLINELTGAALVAAALVSTILFPLVAGLILRGGAADDGIAAAMSFGSPR